MLSTVTYQEIIERGVTQWNEWRDQNPSHHPDLKGIQLTQAYLFGINLSGANLKGADLHRACLIGADLSNTDLSNADLSGAYLNEAILRSANLSNADLTNAQLAQADLENAQLEGTCLVSTPPAKAEEPDKETDKSVAKIKNDTVYSKQAQARQTQTRPSQVLNSQDERSQTVHSQTGYAQAWRKGLMRKCQRAALNLQHSFSRQTPSKAVVTYEKHNPETLPIPIHPNIIRDTGPTQITADCLQKCYSALMEYYVAPIAQMLIDEVMTERKPETPQQLMDFIAEQLPSDQAETVTRAILG